MRRLTQRSVRARFLVEDIDLATVAEGVEHPDQRDALRRLGCTRAQGYLFARPLDADAVAGFVRDAAGAAA